jgi:hypothetical protein
MLGDNRINIYWPCLVFLYSLVHVFLLPEEFGRQAIEDSGLFSWLTILLALAAMIIILRHAGSETSNAAKLSLYATAYVILIYALREADFHRLFTEEHVTKLKFYRHPDIAMVQKLLAGIPMFLLLGCFFYLVIRYTGTVFSGLLKKSPWAVSLVLWGATIFVSQLFDKSDFNNTYRGRVVEELMEFCAAGFMLISATIGIASLKQK